MTQHRDAQEVVRAALGRLPRTAAPPAAAIALLERAARSERALRRRFRVAVLAAVTVVVAIGAVAVAGRRTADPFPAPFMDEIALDHLHYAQRTNGAQFSGPREDLARWFAPTLGHPMRLRPVEATDYHGGRNCWLRGKYAALVFAERAQHRLSLFEIPEVSPRRAACGISQGVRVCAVPDPDGGSRVLVGDLPEPEMMRLLSESI